MLPRNFVRGAVDSGESAVKLRMASRLLRAPRIDAAGAVLPGEPLEHTGADRPRHVEIAGVRTVWHWRPVGAPLTGRLERHRLVPEGLKDAAGFDAGLRVGALRHGRVAARIGLRLGRLLARLLRHRALVDPDQRLPVGTIEDVNPPGL